MAADGRPFGGLAITEVTRYWTVAELNDVDCHHSPGAGQPRLWIGIALSTLAVTVARIRLELRTGRAVCLFSARLRQSHSKAAAPPPLRRNAPGSRRPIRSPSSRHSCASTCAACALSPLFGLITLFTAVSTISEFQANTDGIMGLPLHPLTGLMLGFFRFGLFQFVLIIVTFYSATLVHREREHGLRGNDWRAPYPDWLMPVSKTRPSSRPSPCC